MSATDMVASDGTRPTLDQEASVIYLNIDHQFSPKLTANLLAQYQFSSYHGGGADNLGEQYFLLGLYVNYRLNPFLSLEGGYNYDYLVSDYKDKVTNVDNRGFDRNRVFLGIRATY